MKRNYSAPDGPSSYKIFRLSTYLRTIDALFNYLPVAKLDKIVVPTLVMVGSDDQVTWPVLAHYMAWKIPNSQFCKIKNAGHVANIERADVFNEKVMTFLTGRAGAR